MIHGFQKLMFQNNMDLKIELVSDVRRENRYIIKSIMELQKAVSVFIEAVEVHGLKCMQTTYVNPGAQNFSSIVRPPFENFFSMPPHSIELLGFSGTGKEYLQL